jgi:hypothetical protein
LASSGAKMNGVGLYKVVICVSHPEISKFVLNFIQEFSIKLAEQLM